MQNDLELQELTQSIAKKSVELFTNIQQKPEVLSHYLERWFETSSDSVAFFPLLLSQPQPIQQMLFIYFQDAMALWLEQLAHWQEGKAVPAEDKRFTADEWVQHPFFNLLSKQYLLAKTHVSTLLERIDCHDPILARRMRFFTQQYLEALSPDNFLHTNPHLMTETIRSQGKNLLKGLHNLLSDIETGTARLVISMTDKKAFKVGENIAVTPGKVIFQNDLMELIQYTPQTQQVNAIPLLIIPPWINKYYILDLSPNNSLIKWLVQQGITVFVISWVNPNINHASKGIADYLNEGPIKAIEAIQTQLQVKQVNTLGFCIGGTLLAMLLAYNKARQIDTIRSATFLASLIDFSDPGDISVYIDEQQVQKLEERMNHKGYLEGHFMASVFNSLRANDLIWAFFIRNYLHGKPPVPFDILFWNADSTNMPAKMHSEYLRCMYLHNELIQPGKIQINDTPLDMSQVDTPTFFVSTIKDHIAPWETTYLGFQVVKGRKRFLLGGSGHIAGIVIPPGGTKYGYYLNSSKPKSSEAWLKNARHHEGSWWPEWLTWLKKESGRLIKAPKLTELPFQAIENAPGTYVLQPSSENFKQDK